MYTGEQYQKALEVYDQTGSVTETIRILGYPARRQTLYNWISRREHLPKGKTTFRGFNTPEHPRHPPLEMKLEMLHRCFEVGEDVQSIAKEYGYSTASIYTWRKKYISKGRVALMRQPKERPRGELVEGTLSQDDEIQWLKSQLQEMQMEIDILKETVEVLKKDPGVDTTVLKNAEKAAIVDALKDRYSLPLLLSRLALAKSSYYYQKSIARRGDKYAQIRSSIITLFHDSKRCYGYRRIHGLLKRKNIRVSEKIVRRIMREEHLSITVRRYRKYNSYRGEITPGVPNLLQRDFHAEKPNQKWLTDITEFSIPSGKVYLSPMIDCFDGFLTAWTIGTAPDAVLVNEMLEKATQKLSESEHPIVHTDRGCHYRWPGWIERMHRAGLVRSMSRKGCSPDNAACEGFFGRLKNEMFYNRDWTGVSIPNFISALDNYLVWYNMNRIKMTLGYMSPVEYRRSLGFAV